MCGIVGVVGSRNATDILIQGLQKLEYRGYDSSGIFVTDEKNRESLVKAVGRISALQEKIGIEVNGSIGIGHTRWATHGKPTENNAHPHTSESGRFVLVHNGVIENYKELKTEYLANDHFIGETDTEIAVHLIGKFAEEGNLSTKEAFQKALSVIEGSFAFAMIDKNDATTLYVAKNKSPLLIGLGDRFNLVGSDAMAMIRETKEFMEIQDNEMVIVKKDSVEIFNQTGEKMERAPYTAELDLSDIGKGTYPYYMLKEIDEQPAVLRRILQHYYVDGQYKIDEEILKAIQQADRLYIVAAGTSYHAGFASKAFFEEMTKTPVELCIASEFGYNMPLLSEKPLFIYISQSGETADSRQVLVKTKALGYPALTITNVAGSTLSREADYTLSLHAGPEIAVASTKAYTAQISVMAVLAKAVGDYIGNIAASEFHLVKELSLVATSMVAVLAEKERIAEKVEEHLKGTRNSFYIGRGEDYYVSMEAALKLKEISYIQCEGFAAGELKHGTIALIEENTPVQAILSHKALAPHTRGNIMEVISRGAKVLTVVSDDLANEDDDIIVPSVHPYLTSLAMVVPTQMIAYYATLQRGLDVDKPRNLAKSVTVE
ncbi:glucosamine--fructose-6-phosphate aminotransferase (isomerizing) [Pilibacter termitis]|uniref:Glutamine--fructose-6-phosphate aminotransferase [isomerizing] n=1 Tax=Pilibacter termitis TaxID=263852 RepID=A0A1T4PI77_9ENTE|nr:glutamine--fructose-6-phosphate transaminase (isomerizing) [Pilibacter termitis]SJZ91255.1 glucosamine--fructose-6-phosphate aminotransferase (isomerizing) [Pilibacter termitis]